MATVQGLRKYRKGKIEALLRIIDELSEDYEDAISETLVTEKAALEGVEDPEEKIKFLKAHLAIVYTSPTTFEKTWLDHVILED